MKKLIFCLILLYPCHSYAFGDALTVAINAAVVASMDDDGDSSDD